MYEEAGTAHSQLFTLRVWVEEVAPGQKEFRGLVKHVLSGESTYFREWTTLVACLEQWVTFEVDDAP
jgi:hypothetical protein